MSYDIYFKRKYKDVENGEIFIRYVAEFNYTSNMSKFFDDFLNFKDDNKKGINGLQGMSCNKAYPIIYDAVRSIEYEDCFSDIFIQELNKKYNAKNGWGSITTAMNLLHNMLDVCEENPTAVISIC